MSEPLYLAKSEDGYPALLPQMANRHGLITGATGTGKTVTLQSMAERLSFAGVPVFMADVKGDLSGAGAAGTPSEKLLKRIAELGLDGFGLRRQLGLGLSGVIGQARVRGDQLVHPGLEVAALDQFVDPLLPRHRADQALGREHRQQEAGRVDGLAPEQGHEPYSRYGTTGAQGLLDILQGDPL